MFTLKVEKVVRHSNEISTIYFNPLKSYPGQFVMLNLFDFEEIPLSLSSPRSVTVKAVGDTTRALISIEAGSIIGIRGPFGNPFTPTDRRALIVAGGIGIAPLRYLYHYLRRKGADVKVLFGAKTSDELIWLDEFENVSCSTDDGSYGFKGDVISLLKDEDLDAYDKIYCCGKEEMLRKAYEIFEERGVLPKAEFSLERYMRCGIGVCGSCVIENGLRVCADGPVFRAEDLEW
jgi:dihydroorotate dehydrogenase electron transfer subunit